MNETEMAYRSIKDLVSEMPQPHRDAINGAIVKAQAAFDEIGGDNGKIAQALFVLKTAHENDR